MKRHLCPILSLLAIAAAQAAEPAKPKYGPTDHPRAVPLSKSNEYFRSPRHPAPDFWALISYYVPQFNPYACSAASVAMLINAARVDLPKTSEDAVVSQQALLEKIKAENWKDRLSDAGAGGEHGVPLDQLGKIVEATFKTFGFERATARVTHVTDASPATKAMVRRALLENEANKNDFIVANFNQQAFTDDADVGHIAPVGAYDDASKRVLILDPDREYYEPYWVSLDTFVSGMSTRDARAGQNRGFVVVTK